MSGSAGGSFRRGARIAGWIAFASFEAVVLVLARMVASIRCCGAGHGASVQSASEGVALVLLVVTMLLLGAAVGSAIMIATEGILRLAERFSPARRGNDSRP